MTKNEILFCKKLIETEGVCYLARPSDFGIKYDSCTFCKKVTNLKNIYRTASRNARKRLKEYNQLKMTKLKEAINDSILFG